MERGHRHYEDHDYGLDPYGNLVYWDSVNCRYCVIEPGKPIADPHVVIGKIGQQNVLPTHFVLKPKDLEATLIAAENGNIVADPVPPGISAFLFFGSKQSRQNSLNLIASSFLGREPTRKNRLYVAQVVDIRGAGWTPYFAPLINRSCDTYNPLHVIMVPDSVLAGGGGNQEEAAAISQVFVRWSLDNPQ